MYLRCRLILATIFVAPAFLTAFTAGSLWFVWLSYAVWLAVVIDVLLFLLFISLYVKSRSVRYSLLYRDVSFKVAVFVPVYNESPALVAGTLRSIIAALKGRGDVFLLDDSTDREVAEALRETCRRLGVRYVRRESRKGFKAGALNYGLRLLRDYDLLAVFDADQRPSEAFFDSVLPYFQDPAVAFVQVPQNYTVTKSMISVAALYQQQPFLRVIMKGRHMRSAFSLGSGTVFRVSVLREIGGFVEDTLTEDVATSVKIHEKGYRSVYLDTSLIWHGEAPRDVVAYLRQQHRWALGSFQTLKYILSAKLTCGVFLEYLAGVLYWGRIGILRLFEIATPLVFLLLGVYVFTLSPAVYLALLSLTFIVPLGVYAYVMQKFGYGVREFLLHKAAEYIAMPAATSAFVTYMAGKKVEFHVTPKGGWRIKRGLIPALYLLLVLTATAVAVGATRVETCFWALAVNQAWAMWHLLHLAASTVVAHLSGGGHRNLVSAN